MKNRAISLDLGTAFLQTAEKNDKGEIELKEIRNSFIELPETEDIEQILKQNKWQYIKDGDEHYYVIGEDSLKIARLFPETKIRRSMKDGVLNKGENKKMLVIASMIENAIGKAEDDQSVVCYCVSSPTIDSKIDNIFHKNRIEGILKKLGFVPKCIDEGLGILFSENPGIITEDGENIPYSGISISWGAGRTNAVLAYRGLQILGMSCNRGGDYIDQKVSEQTDFPISKVIYVKENKLNFNKTEEILEDDLLFGLQSYYTNLIEYVIKNFARKFKEIKSEFEAPLDIVLAGGTSMPPGFRDMVEKVIKSFDLPFKIKNIIQSKDPRNSVVKGLLVQAIISQKKLEKDELSKALD